MKNENNKSLKKNTYSKFKFNKSAQIQVTFNWIYILIAGAVILLFFVGIVVKQKVVAEENLASEVVEIMGKIFTGAGVSDKTKNFINASGLAEYTFFYSCEEGLSEFGVKGQGLPLQEKNGPIFAPKEIKTTQFILWSLPYNFPFYVIDFVFLTSYSTKYYLFGSGGNFAEDFISSTERFNREEINDLTEINPGKIFQVRIIDLDGVIVENSVVPETLKLMADDKVSVVSFQGAEQVNYYQKNGALWKKLNPEPVQIVSLGGKNDAAKYAAIFSGDHNIYYCNMGKAFRRLEYLIELNDYKLKDMENYYESNPELSLFQDCLNYIKSGYTPNVRGSLGLLKANLDTCLIDYPNSYSYCTDMWKGAEDLYTANKNLGDKGNCLTLY